MTCPLNYVGCLLCAAWTINQYIAEGLRNCNRRRQKAYRLVDQQPAQNVIKEKDPNATICAKWPSAVTTPGRSATLCDAVGPYNSV